MEVQLIHTTVNLNTNMAAEFDKSAQNLGIKRSTLMVLLMRRLLANWEKITRHNSSVQYQEHQSDAEWKVVHVFLNPKDYEVCTDMRKFFKWSVSALLAMAIKLYLIEILDVGKKGIKKYCDNYNIHNHKLYGKLDKNNICWHITWELDEKFIKKLTR